MHIDEKLIVSSSPHIRSELTTRKLMLDVIIALTPAMIGSIYFFGLASLKIILLSVLSAVLSEMFIQKLFKKEVTIYDLSAVVTGILLAFNLPASAPWWLPIVGSVFAIVVVKQFFGGIGSNFMNPALAGRAMLLASWPTHMSSFTNIRPDVVATATPLTIIKSGTSVSELPHLRDMFIGGIPGAIGETSAILLLIGAAYLIYKKVIDWRIPATYIGTVIIMLLLLRVEPSLIPYHILGGGLILGSFFMATDYSSTPVTPKGRIVFALGAGILTAIIRVKGGYPEGVSYSILLMNVATPLIERFTKPKVFGKGD